MLRRFFHQTLGPLILLIVCPPIAMLMWYLNAYHMGCLAPLKTAFFPTLYQACIPPLFASKTAWVMLLVFSAIQLAFMKWLPGKPFKGPISPKGNVPLYKANGPLAFILTLALYCLAAFPLKLFSPTLIYDNFGPLLASSCLFSWIFCLFLYFKGRFYPSSADHSTSHNFIFDYYWGTELYPRVLGIDLKQFTNCRFGMMSWPLILLSFGAKQYELYGLLSNSMIISILLQLIYVSKFFLWETGYLRSLDIMHDRAGYYICWGCLVFVPAIYPSATLYLVHHPIQLEPLLALLIFALGSASILTNYMADRQRQRFRAHQGEMRIFGKEPKMTVAKYTTTEGEEKTNLLLASGFWGISRHFHYLPEMLGAFFWSLPALFTSPLPYFYVTFLTILLIQRSFRHDKRCALKYGKHWEEHCEKVPYKLIPFIY